MLVEELTVPANQASWDDLQAVLGTRGPAATCQCQRYKLRPKEAFAKFPVEERARRLLAQTNCGRPESPTTSGLVAYRDDESIGWCAVEPRPAYEGLLRNNRVPWEGRSENKANDRVWAVTCVFTRVGFRRRGIGTALVRAAVVCAGTRRPCPRGLSADHGGAEVPAGRAPRRQPQQLRRRRVHRGQPPDPPPGRDADRFLGRRGPRAHVSVTLSAVDWLLGSDEPGIVAQAKRDLLDERAPAEAAQVLEGPKVRALLAGQRADGGFGTHAYAKWGGAHWRLVSLVELGVPAGEPRCLAAAETVLAWLTGKGHRDRIQVIDGLTRRCGSQEGNTRGLLPAWPRRRSACPPARGVSCRVAVARRRLELRQEGDGLPLVLQRVAAADVGPARVLGGDRRDEGAEAAERTAELFLEHRLFRALATGAPIRESFVTVHSPPFWLRLLPGARRARPDGARRRPARCRRPRPAGGAKAPGRPLACRRPLVEGAGLEGSNVEAVDWGSGPNELLTLHALRMLRAAGRTASV